jgi:repressor of nif and glnA expression
MSPLDLVDGMDVDSGLKGIVAGGACNEISNFQELHIGIKHHLLKRIVLMDRLSDWRRDNCFA